MFLVHVTVPQFYKYYSISLANTDDFVSMASC